MAIKNGVRGAKGGKKRTERKKTKKPRTINVLAFFAKGVFYVKSYDTESKLF